MKKEVFMEKDNSKKGQGEQQQQELNSKRPYPKLDYTIVDPQQRNKIVHEIIKKTPPEKITSYYLEQLTKYLTQTPKSKKEKEILTDNRMITVNKRQTSYEGLVEKLENGEDGIYNFMTGGDKNILLVPKIQITEDDIATIPGLKELREQIKKIEEKQKNARGKQKYLLTKQLIEMRQDQYILKSSFKPPVTMMKLTKSVNKIDLNQKIEIDKNGEPISNGLISFFNPHHVCCLLCNYSKIKEEAWGYFDNDWWYLMEDFDNLIDKALKQEYPILYDIVIYKIDGLQNKDISIKLKQDYEVTYSVEYLSSVWRKKIPKIISDKAKEQWILWYYTYKAPGQWKRCSRCHEIKLAHSYFFTKNKTSKDGWYSMCKECRNKKKIIVQKKDKKN